jgi:hypothetical protein
VPFDVVRVQYNLNFLNRFSKKSSSTKLYGNPASRSPVAPYGQTKET